MGPLITKQFHDARSTQTTHVRWALAQLIPAQIKGLFCSLYGTLLTLFRCLAHPSHIAWGTCMIDFVIVKDSIVIQHSNRGHHPNRKNSRWLAGFVNRITVSASGEGFRVSASFSSSSTGSASLFWRRNITHCLSPVSAGSAISNKFHLQIFNF